MDLSPSKRLLALLANELRLLTERRMDAFQIDSNVWQGTTDFRAALIGLAWADALYSGDLALVRQRLDVMELHSFVDFFDESDGLVNKPGVTMESKGCSCPASWALRAGLPDGVYEALGCTCNDLIDWPSASRDGYTESNRSESARSKLSSSNAR